MNNTSKLLKNQDLSGEIFTQELFKNDEFKKLFLDFDRIHLDARTKTWVIIDHILIDKKVNHVNELPEDKQIKIKKLLSFGDLLSEKSGCKTQIIIDLFFSSNDLNKNSILLMKEDYSFEELSMMDFSLIFRELNFFGEEKNCNKIFDSKKIIQPNFNRSDDSAFEVSKSLLLSDVTYGFNIDKIIYNEEKKEVCLFEYLLCEEEQTVNPYSSHPNNYFNKNSKKFINLFCFSQAIKSPLYLLNYAKPNTKHYGKILWMKVLDIDPNNKFKKYVLTKDKQTTTANLECILNKTFFKNNKPQIKIGI